MQEQRLKIKVTYRSLRKIIIRRRKYRNASSSLRIYCTPSISGGSIRRTRMHNKQHFEIKVLKRKNRNSNTSTQANESSSLPSQPSFLVSCIRESTTPCIPSKLPNATVTCGGTRSDFSFANSALFPCAFL